MSDKPQKPEDADPKAKFGWGADDVVWGRGPAPPGTPPLMTPEEIAIAEENLRRIEAGLPLLNGNPPYPVKRGARDLPDDTE